MYMMFLMIILTWLILTIIMMIIIPTINKHKTLDREKSSPFECGFDPFTNSRLPFSIHFFSISLMFLIFDIEITLILPIPIMKDMMTQNNWMSFCFFMITILILGLLLEWKESSMEWK